MKIVLDTNVLVSALIKGGKPRDLLFEIIRGKHKLILSVEILEEFGRTANNPKIRRYVEEQDVARFLKDVASASKIVKIKSRYKVVSEDPNDDDVVRTAYDGKADYIVSGDKHLLELKKFRRIKIISTDDMLSIIKK